MYSLMFVLSREIFCSSLPNSAGLLGSGAGRRCRKRQPWTETVEEFGARLRDICDHINTHIDAEGLCKGLPSRAQNLGSNPEGSALFLLEMHILLHMSFPGLPWRVAIYLGLDYHSDGEGLV